jgi:acyl carrier protein
MTDAILIASIETTARDIFRQPTLAYRETQIFREIPGFDSILAIQFILAIEAALDITLNEDQVDTMHTMGDLLRMVKLLKGLQASVGDT